MLESISIVLMTDWNSIQFLLRLAMSLSPSKLDAFPRSTGYSEDFKPSKQIGGILWNCEVVLWVVFNIAVRYGVTSFSKNILR